VSARTAVAARPYQPGYETVAARIVTFIAQSDLQPGDRLPTELALAERMGVSRTVIREAVKLLSASGRVRARRGSGLYVASEPRPFATAAIDLSMPVDPEHMLGLFEFRATLEMQTARLAAERATPREVQALREAAALSERGAETADTARFGEGDNALHQGIAEASRNPFLASAVSTVLRLQDWAITMVITGAPGSLRVAAAEHASLVAAIGAGRADDAAAAMRAHLDTVATAYQQEARRRVIGGKAHE